MASNDRCKTFHIEIVRGETARPDSRLTLVSITTDPQAIEPGQLPLDVRFPELAPSVELCGLHASGRVDVHEFIRNYSLELERHPEQCELLRFIACDSGLAFVVKNDDNQHRSVADAMKQHLERLECQRRWDAGLIIGGYVYPLRDEIEQAGGLWHARHLAWMMPDRESWNYVQSLLPGNF